MEQLHSLLHFFCVHLYKTLMWEVILFLSLNITSYINLILLLTSTDNKIGDTGAIALAASLPICSSLEMLYLDGI